MFQQTCLSHADAQRIIDAIRAELEEHRQGAAIAVVDAHGELIAFLRTDGCPLPSIHNAINKAFTAARERKPSADLGASSRSDSWPLSNFGDMRYIGWGGGVPIWIGDQVVGAVGVSGLPEAADMELAQMGAALFS